MAKKIYRLPPCPGYQFPRMESWLEDMAAKGYTPEFGSFFGLVKFHPSEPQVCRYRLEPSPKGRSIWDNQEPSPEMLELTREFGWEFLGKFEEFFVYRTADPDARELNTDPDIQAIALNALKKRFTRGFLQMAFYFSILCCFILPSFCLNLVTFGSAYILLLLFLLIATVIGQFLALWQIYQFQKQLRAGESLSHQTDWCKSSRPYRASAVIQYLLAIVLLFCWASYGMKNFGFFEHPIAEYPGQPPFVTLAELVPENSDVTIQHIRNTAYESWSDPLFPTCVTWLDGGMVYYGDEATAGGLLEVQYCEAVSPWLARAVAEGYMESYDAEDVVLLEDLGLDYAARFTSRHGIPRAVLVEGNTVICVRMSMGDSNGIFTLENWVNTMATRMMDGS